MDLAEEIVGTTLTVRVDGELDMATVGAFRQLATARLGTPAVRTLVVDLGGCTFTDSAGLTALVETLGDASRAQVPFELVGVNRQVRKLMELTSLLGLFTIR